MGERNRGEKQGRNPSENRILKMDPEGSGNHGMRILPCLRPCLRKNGETGCDSGLNAVAFF